MTRWIVLFVVWLAATSQASAQWRTSVIPDDVLPATKIVSLEASDSASPVTGSLTIGCSGVSGDRRVTLILSERQPGNASVSWALDKEPPRQQDVADLIRSYSAADLPVDPKRLGRAKRLHVEWLSSKGTRLAYDFKLAGAEKAIKRVRCVRAVL